MTNLRKRKKLTHVPRFPTSTVKPRSFVRKACVAFFPTWSLTQLPTQFLEFYWFQMLPWIRNFLATNGQGYVSELFFILFFRVGCLLSHVIVEFPNSRHMCALRTYFFIAWASSFLPRRSLGLSRWPKIVCEGRYQARDFYYKSQAFTPHNRGHCINSNLSEPSKFISK